jgi:hypothetical protein
MLKILRGARLRALTLVSCAFVACSFAVAAQQQSSGTLRGLVTDEVGAVIIGATVTVADATGVERTATTDEEGRYTFSSLPPGRYTVRASATGFAFYENPGVEVAAGRADPLDITLSVAIEQETVTVTAEAPISTEPENNAGAVVLRGADLDALPDDPDDLAEALEALAGPSAGQGGGQTFIDGFTGGRLPPKESIREIRINRNPFSAEYERLGYGRVEIFTKPGTDRMRGQAFFNFNDESLNARNPFAFERAPFQSRRYGGNLSGPIKPGRTSFFLDFERREIDDNDVVNAVVLDPSLNIVGFNQSLLSPVRRTTFSPRLDYQLNPTNTLVARYTYERNRRENAGVGDFNLPERAFDTSNTQHTFQLTETAVINQRVINETRFQYVRERRRQEGETPAPTLRVLEAFTGGGAQVGLSLNNEDRFELSNYTSWSVGNHSLRAGARLRSIRITDISPQNFAGTVTFGGGLAPQLDANNQIVFDGAGQPVLVPITSIERFRRTVLLQNLGLSPAEIRTRGGGATQFSIAGGNPQASITQTDFGPFIQDDWRLRPDFTLSLGLRYEAQTNVSNNLNFAPRVAFAWSPGAGAGQQRAPQTVIRGGFGIFYERFAESLSLQANRFNGENQQQFVVTGGTDAGLDVLNQLRFDAGGNITNILTVEQLTGFNVQQTVRRVAEDIRAPYTMQAALSVERQLPYRVTLSVNFITARTLHVLRSRNINAPLPGTTDANGRGGIRPIAGVGNVFQYESSGRFNQNQLIISANNRLSRRFTLFATYTLNSAHSDTDGANSFPSNQYDLTNEYGRSVQDIRHRLFVGGSLTAPWNIRLNPFVVANSGRPFNITTGRDTNGDTLFTERPAFATDLSKPGVVVTRFGAFDPNPAPGQAIIPRNFGTGPSFFTVNMRISRTFGFGSVAADAGGAGAGGGRRGAGGGGGGGGRRGGGGGGGGGRRGGGGFGGGGGGEGDGGGGSEGRYSLTVSANIQNLFNNTNLGTPIGNLSSSLFGQSVTTSGGFGGGGGGNPSAGNRRIELQVRFNF